MPIASPKNEMNLPNSLTVLRIFFVPLLVVVLLTRQPNWNFWGLPVHFEVWGVLILLVAAATDAMDGYIARKRREVTTLGILLDPIADKLLISAAFISLVQMDLVPAWMVVIIIGREFIVVGLREIASVEGLVIPASALGKTKMILQVLAGCAVILTANHPALQSLGHRSALAGGGQRRGFRDPLFPDVLEPDQFSRAGTAAPQRCGGRSERKAAGCPHSVTARRALLELARRRLILAVERAESPRKSAARCRSLESSGGVRYAAQRGRLRGCIGQIGSEAIAAKSCSALREGCGSGGSAVRAGSGGRTRRKSRLKFRCFRRLEEIAPDEIEVGQTRVDGRAEARGAVLLLPQVADRMSLGGRRFLEETCVKAGLEPRCVERAGDRESRDLPRKYSAKSDVRLGEVARPRGRANPGYSIST